MKSAHKTMTRMHREKWAEHLAVWQRSGLTQTEYCRKNNLNPCSLSAWKTKLALEDDSIPFVEITPRQDQLHGDDDRIELILEGIRIKLREGIDPIRLRNIVIALSGV